MYESFYGLSANPFSLVPDPRFFFGSAGHKRGLAYLRYGLHQAQGFVVVTGMPGTGKSMLVQTLLSEIPEDEIYVASLVNTNLDADDVLQAVANQFGVYKEGDSKASVLMRLEQFLNDQHRRGKRVLLLVDEAQNLPAKSLEELRMLSNFQQGNQALLQIMLLGQQQLQAVLADPDMEQLTQRITASCHLMPMNALETRSYIEHRLTHVGWSGRLSFSGEALGLIYSCSQGVPRLINVFCDRLLLAALLEEKTVIDTAHVELVIEELKNEATGNWVGININSNDAVLLPALPDELPQEADKKKAAALAVDRLFSESIPLPDNVAAFPKQSRTIKTADDTFKPLPVSTVGSAAAALDVVNDPAPSVEESEPEEKDDEKPFAHLVVDESPVGSQDDVQVQPVYSAATDSPVVKPKGGRFFIAAMASIAVVTTVLIVSPLDSGTSGSRQVAVPASQPQTESVLVVDVANEQQVVVSTEQVIMSEPPTPLLIEQKPQPVLVSVPLVQPVVSRKVSTPKPDKRVAKIVAVTVPVAVKKPLLVKSEPKPKQQQQQQVKVAVSQKPAPIDERKEAAIVKPKRASIPAPIKVESIVFPVSGQTEQLLPPPASEDVSVPVSVVAEFDLSELLFSFANSYEEADISSLMALITKDALLDGSIGRREIEDDFKGLFDETEMRKMQVVNMLWTQQDGVVKGRGNIELTEWFHNEDRPAERSGVIEMIVVTDGKQLLIKKVSYILNQ